MSDIEDLFNPRFRCRGTKSKIGQQQMIDLSKIANDRAVLIAGPTASGKSELALQIAESRGGQIINADALQVFANWRVLTARPGAAELERAPHALYGHVPGDFPYSVGHWLSDLAPLLNDTTRPIIVGGTGLYFSALTDGLADIPPIPDAIRVEAGKILETQGLVALLAEIDQASVRRIDTKNPMRVQRAWEVLKSTGKGIADWQDETPPPLLPPNDCEKLVLTSDRHWLADRIERRFDQMLERGALEEARANLENWDPTAPSSKAIGATELIAHVAGNLDLSSARDSAVLATLRYAKRQRTWFRSRMSDWTAIKIDG